MSELRLNVEAIPVHPALAKAAVQAVVDCNMPAGRLPVGDSEQEIRDIHAWNNYGNKPIASLADTYTRWVRNSEEGFRPALVQVRIPFDLELWQMHRTFRDGYGQERDYRSSGIDFTSEHTRLVERVARIAWLPGWRLPPDTAIVTHGPGDTAGGACEYKPRSIHPSSALWWIDNSADPHKSLLTAVVDAADGEQLHDLPEPAHSHLGNIAFAFTAQDTEYERAGLAPGVEQSILAAVVMRGFLLPETAQRSTS